MWLPRAFQGKEMRERLDEAVIFFLLKFLSVSSWDCKISSYCLCLWLSAPKACRIGVCGRGECVLTSTAPFYECKCKYPFQPPDCKRCKDQTAKLHFQLVTFLRRLLCVFDPSFVQRFCVYAKPVQKWWPVHPGREWLWVSVSRKIQWTLLSCW